jgi:hypothetical protein
MGRQNKIPETLAITIIGTNETLADILNDQYGRFAGDEARTMLEEKNVGEVWTDEELRQLFAVSHFDPPYVKVTRKSDGCRGTVAFIDSPRLYFSFNAESEPNDT